MKNNSNRIAIRLTDDYLDKITFIKKYLGKKTTAELIRNLIDFEYRDITKVKKEQVND